MKLLDTILEKVADKVYEKIKIKEDEPLEVKIKYLRDIYEIKIIKKGNWIDLRAGENIALKKHEYCEIPLGIAMQIPEGYEAYIIPRSSSYKKYFIIQTNSKGLIDTTYCGDDDEWKLPVYAMEDTIINKNERICQFRIAKTMPKISLNKVDVLGNKNRDGIGSTGRI